jgi:hypothetical protein
MLNSNLKGRVVKAGAGLAAAGLVIGSSIVGGSPAGADPKQFSAFVGYGSDTTQDILNALSGEANATNYTPIQSTLATGKKQIVSWDATGSTCITPKAGGATINRPNGSTAGRRALSRAIDGTTYGNASCGAAATGKPVSGLVDYARSSAGPSSGDTGTALTYIPFGRDGMSFGYYANGVATPVTSLTRAQLTTLFTTGPQNIGGVNVIPCGIQTGSGTYAFWQTVTTATATQENTATTACNAAGNGQRLQENDAAGLKAKGDAQAGSQVVVGFSAANFISQSNGKAASQLAAGVDLGSISDNGVGTNLGKPYAGTAPNLTPTAAFYNDATFGRTVYNVFDTARVAGPGNNDIKSVFVGGTSAICVAAAQTTVNAFGFLSVANCGSIALTGSLIAGTL